MVWHSIKVYQSVKTLVYSVRNVVCSASVPVDNVVLQYAESPCLRVKVVHVRIANMSLLSSRWSSSNERPCLQTPSPLPHVLALPHHEHEFVFIACVAGSPNNCAATCHNPRLQFFFVWIPRSQLLTRLDQLALGTCFVSTSASDSSLATLSHLQGVLC